MKEAVFVILRDKAGGWIWHLKSANGRIIARGESHTRKADAMRALKTVVRTARTFYGL